MTVDAANSAAGLGDISTVTVSHTVSAGTNRYLAVGVSMKTGDAQVDSVTYGGVPLSPIGFVASAADADRTEMWQLVNPAVGNADVVVNISGDRRLVVGVISFFGVHQTTPHGGFVSAFGQSTLPTVTIASSAADLVLDTVTSQGDALTLTVGPGQTERWNRFSQKGKGKKGKKGKAQKGSRNDAWSAGSTEPGAVTVVMSWTLGEIRNWSIGAISIHTADPDVTLLKSVLPAGDQPPGTDLDYTVLFTNAGGADAVTVVLTDPIPADTDLQVGSVTTSPGTTGLTVTVEYSDDGEVTYTYTPVSGGGGAPPGFDRNLTHVRWTFAGTLVHTAPDNTFSIGLTVRVR